jgi:glycosyltransferase involved in cell wall biosynthesis
VLVDASALAVFADHPEVIIARRAALLLSRPAALDSTLRPTERATRAGLEKRLLPLFARVIVTNAATAEHLQRDGLVNAADLTVLACGSCVLPRSEGSGEESSLLLSRDAPDAQEGLLRALARLPDLAWRLVLAGDTGAALAGLATELRLTERLQTVADSDSVWRRADLLVQASAWDGYGLAVAEALRRGLPVVSCSGGAPQALLAGSGGVACPEGDLVTLSKVLRRLLCDRALRTELAEAAWRAGQTLPDWPTQAALLVATLGG